MGRGRTTPAEARPKLGTWHNHSPGDHPPPEGPPWDVPMSEAPLAFLDFEMTGLRVGEDRVVEVCVERIRGSVVEARLESVVRPDDWAFDDVEATANGEHADASREPSTDAKRREVGGEHVHGIGDEELKNAPTFAELVPTLENALSGAVIVAHGAAWDLAFLDDELARAGRHELAPVHAIDTLVLARRAFHLPSYGLSALADSLGVRVDRSHRAADDVTTLRAVFAHLIAALKPTTPRDLWNVRIGDRVARAAIIESLQKAIAEQRPVEVVYRPARHSPETYRMIVTALSPPRAIGYLLPGRGRRELRIDRILRVGEPPLTTP